MKKITTKVVTVLLILVFSQYQDSNLQAQIAKFASIADIHYFNPDLLIQDGTAFQSYIMQDRKLIAESDAITQAIVAEIKTLDLDFIIVPGDLTKDGAKVSHEALADYFKEIETAGIQIFVTPGNHDINNPHALQYDSEAVQAVATVSPEEFKTIYADYGFDEAIAKDDHSLSYVAEPVDGVWIIAMDICKYANSIIADKKRFFLNT